MSHCEWCGRERTNIHRQVFVCFGCGHEAELEKLRQDLADTRRFAAACEATLQRLTRTSAEVVAVVEAARSLLVADGQLNIWCMATHGHVPHGWLPYMDALKRMRDALDALDALAAKEAQTNAQ